MENRFYLWDPEDFIREVLLVIGFAGVFLLGFGLGMGSLAGWLIGIGLAGFILAVGGYGATHHVHEIRLGKSSTVTFSRVLGSVTMAVNDITVVRGIRTASYDGSVEWEMEVRDRHGRVVRVGYFHRAREFVTDLTALNPGIDVYGEWPSIGFPLRQ